MRTLTQRRHSRALITFAGALALASVLSGGWRGSAGADEPPSADLSVEIGALVYWGETYYSAYVTNNGPDTAVAVTLNGTLLGDMAPGATRESELGWVREDQGCGGYAIAASSTADPDLSNNQAPYGLTCEPCERDPLVLEIPTDFVVTEGSDVVVDATATGTDTLCVDPLPPYWTQTAGVAVLPQDPHVAEDLSFTAPDGPTTLTLVLNYDGQTRALNITVLDSTPTFERFLSPLSTSPARKSGALIAVKFLLTDSFGSPITSTAGVLMAALTPGTTTAPCAWSATVGAFQCNLKPPKGLGVDNPYTIAVHYEGVPLPAATTTISFRR